VIGGIDEKLVPGGSRLPVVGGLDQVDARASLTDIANL
jgi:hypothetical protein